ncbi:signal transduction histidine kinase [Geodermatophilus sabuli]|uniref:histidine kinase n=1 Tax=Geodermatophilus sabuli TaxID=1564158 RepID=A0A285EBW5_9ACTN|nr:signal transduction histidine kinase [Geodermatophilus sabuli]SNX96622.1 Signal transduction histidine kinase [Geodermatophilus sabuli]
MPHSATSLLRITSWVTMGLGAVYAVTLVPGVRPTPGYRPGIDWWLNTAVDVGVVLVLALRTLVDRRDRAAWLFMTAGLVAALAGSTAYFAYYQHLDPIPSPSWADAGWLAFYALLAVGLVLRLRTRARRMPFSLSLDGLIAGLTAAALAENYVDGAAVPLGGDSTATLTTAYPIADLLLLALAVAALAMLRIGAGWSWWLLCASFVTFFVTDTIYAELVARGAYVGGEPVDLGWLLARLLLAGAALASLRWRESRTVDLEGVSVLALPGVCGLAVLGMLFHGSHAGITPFASVVALVAGVLMVGRTALTFRELRVLTELRQRALSERLVEAQDDERARIAADVHDDSIQALAAVDLRLGALRNRLRDRAPEEAVEVETAMDAVHGASDRLRHLLFELETPVLDATLTDGLRDAAAQVFEDSQVACTVEERGRAPLPQRARVSAYRIAREALVNARKHAEARTVTVTVDATVRGVEVHVVDDGRGTAATASLPSGRRHSGVVAMRDRALASGGWWRSAPGPGGIGTAVAFSLPVAGAGESAAPSTGDPLAGQQSADDVGRTGHGHDEVARHAPAEQPGEVTGDGSLEQVGRPAGGQHAGPRGGVRLR